MLNSQFFLFSLMMVVAYGLQGALQARYIRAYDALSVGVIRNISLACTMLPVLLFVPSGQFAILMQHKVTLALASCFGALGLWMAFSAAQYLPIGVGTALRQMSHTVGAVLLGVFLFGEFLTSAQLLCLGGIVASGIALILLKVDYEHLDTRHVGRGIALTLGAGLIVSLSFFLFSSLARVAHPYAVAYFWEAGVGLMLLFSFVIRANTVRFPVPRVSVRDIATISAISLLTILGTIGYASAVNHGPYALVSGLMSMTTLVAIGLGGFLYKEHVTRTQIALMCASVACMLLLKMVS